MTWISTPKGLYGESGIRTHGTLTSTHAFQACTFGHSVISPGLTRCPWQGRGRRSPGPAPADPVPVPISCKSSRREWDSNPRSRKRLNGFRDRPIRPLSHLSETLPRRHREVFSVPKRIRTSGLWIRNPMLYPAELWAHFRRASFRMHPARLDFHTERGGFEPPVPFRGTTP